MWRRIQKEMFGQKSTTQLFKSKEIDDIVDTITKLITERTNGEVFVDFPSFDNMLIE